MSPERIVGFLVVFFAWQWPAFIERMNAPPVALKAPAVGRDLVL
jgi:hypothetical protein